MQQYRAFIEGIEVRLSSIGSIECEYGVDRYVLLEMHDTPITHEQAMDLMYEQFGRDSSGPGSIYCNRVRVVPDGDDWIGVAQIRYDV